MNRFTSQMLRFFLLPLLAGTLLATVGCDDQSGKDPDDSDVLCPDDGVLTPINDLAAYTIVRPTAISDLAFSSALELKEALTPLVGSIEVVEDWSKDGTYDKSTPEILIGNVKRDETTAAKAWIDQNKGDATSWYYIGVDGAKIVLLGSDELTLIGAARHLSLFYLRDLADGTASVSLPKQVLHTDTGARATAVSLTEKGKPVSFAAEVDLGQAPWFADTTGKQDMTRLIQNALDYAASLGGGIVYLPAGTYTVTKPLTVASAVTLRGAYADPDTQSLSEGTLLRLTFKGAQRTKNAVTLDLNAAVQGIAFHYPEQDLSGVYGFTVCGTQNSFTVRDCTFINSYNGISSGQNAIGMVTIEGIKGTVLHVGIEAEQHADICTMLDVNLSPTYWAKLGEAFGAPSEEAIRAAMKQNGSIGLALGDVDRDTHENVTLDGFDIGIYNRKLTRAGCSGSFYELRILNARIGIDAEGINGAYGLCLVGGEIRAEELSVNNRTVSDGKYAVINLLNTKVTGKTAGKVSYEANTALTFAPRSHQTPAAPAKLFSVLDYGADPTGKTDLSTALQAALNAAEAAGGGIVYIPAGQYRLDKPISGGANVCIQGAHPNAQGATTDFSGTVLYVTWGRGLGETGEAAITLTGDNSGVTGLSVYYPENGVRESMTKQTVNKAIVSYSPFLRCRGDNSYLTFVCLIAASRVVHFEGADSFVADRLMGNFYDCGVYATDCKDGLVSRIHTNGTYHIWTKDPNPLLGDDWFNDGQRLHEVILDTLLAERLTQVKLKNCQNQQITHTFYYAGRYLIEAEASTLTLLCGEGARSATESFVLHGNADLTVIISNRPNPAPYIKMNGSGNKAFMNQMNNSVGVFTGPV